MVQKITKITRIFYQNNVSKINDIIDKINEIIDEILAIWKRSVVINVESGTVNGEVKITSQTTNSNNVLTSSTKQVSIPGWTTKANLDSPTFTGTPKAPTAAATVKTTQIATTAYVYNAMETNEITVATVTELWNNT